MIKWPYRQIHRSTNKHNFQLLGLELSTKARNKNWTREGGFNLALWKPFFFNASAKYCISELAPHCLHSSYVCVLNSTSVIQATMVERLEEAGNPVLYLSSSRAEGAGYGGTLRYRLQVWGYTLTLHSTGSYWQTILDLQHSCRHAKRQCTHQQECPPIKHSQKSLKL